ncbi:hypothetical protein AB0A95_33395 [Micromonospora sp. NPDC049230]|uniref:hypothetical protein n=1 Tax=Micromonospora sp. NPDC049230 TaxID=3155502 RepID=UPI0033EA3C80
MTSRTPDHIYRREAYPTDRPPSIDMTHDEQKWLRWSNGRDFVVDQGGEVRLFAGDITWRRVAFDPTDRRPTAPTNIPRLPGAVAEDIRRIAAEYTAKGDQIMDGDGAYGGRLVEELTEHLVRFASELDRIQAVSINRLLADADRAQTIARAAAEGAVHRNEHDGWHANDLGDEVPDAVADAVVAALAACGLLNTRKG